MLNRPYRFICLRYICLQCIGLLSIWLWHCGAIAENSNEIELATLKRISTAEGMSQGTINHFYQDDKGYVWLSSAEGLNLYNGYNVRAFLPEGFFESSYVEFVFQDKEGFFWISVSEQGLFRFDAESGQLNKLWDATDTFVRDVMAWHMDSDDDTLWFFTTNAILKYSLSQNLMKEHLAKIPQFIDEQYIYSVEKMDDFFWLGTNKGVFRYDPKEQSVLRIEIHDTNVSKVNTERTNRIRKIQKDLNGNLWVATARGLFRLSAKQLDPQTKNSSSNKIHKIYASSIIPGEQFFDLLLEESRMLVASQNGLVAIHLNSLTTETVLKFSHSNYEIFNDRIIRLFKDHNSNYWLASNARGAFVWDPKTRAFKNYFNSGERKLFSSNEIWSIEETENNVLWLGTTNGLTRFDLNLDTSEFYLETIKSLGFATEVYGLSKDSEDNLWLSTSEGVVYFDTQRRQEIPIPLIDESHREIFESANTYLFVDKFDDIWISGAESFYIYNFQSGLVTELEHLKDEIDPYFSLGFIGVVPKTSIMLLSVSGQLWGVDLTSREPFLIHQVSGYSPQELVYVDDWLVDEKQGLLWLSYTTNGLVALSLDDFSVVSHLRSDKQEQIETVYGLIKDNKRRIWFSSHNGIYHYGLDNEHLMNYDLSNGLSALEYNSGASLQLRSGKVVYGSVHGLTIFDPEVIGLGNDPHNKVVIDSVNVASKSKIATYSDLAGKEFQIAHDDKGLTIQFSTLGLEQQERVLYQYELLGIEHITFPLTSEPRARFSQLAAGKYEFVVRAFSPVTGYRTKPASIFLDVEYTPWKSPIAIFLYVLVFVVCFSLVVLNRNRKQEVLLAINKQLFSSEKRLRIALNSSLSKAWEWNNVDKRIQFVVSLNESEGMYSETFKEHLDRIHVNDRAEFLREWQILFNSRDTDAFSFTYRYQQNEQEYHWYQNSGQILSRDLSGAPNQISGLLSDINEFQTLTARAMVFGEALRNTKDWVLIIDSGFNSVMANHSFYAAFNLEVDSKIQLNDQVFRGLDRKLETYRQIMEQMTINEHWHGEEHIQLSDTKIRNVLINISLIKLKNNDQKYYVIIFTDVSHQKAAEKELKKLSNYDVLTELPNRTLLMDRIEHAIKVADQNDLTLALLFIDLDRFKQINDSLGRELGDELLKVIAIRMQKLVKKQDTVARLGGDEFVILLESFNDITQVGELARRINQSIARPIDLDKHKVRITSSIGIALYPGDAKDADELLRDADIAMYHAQKTPGDCYHFYTDDMDLQVRNKLQKESDLKQAHVNQEFINYYQPIVSISGTKIVGAELLLRWQRPSGIVSPDEFIPLSEQIGLIIPMTNEALRRALKDVQIWRERIPDFYLSVNLSVIHFEQEGIVQTVAVLLKEFKVPASALRIEVTESALMTHPQKAIQTMQEFRAVGIHLALDDFGTGYSSIAYLKNLPLDIIKLDRNFTWGIGRDQKDETIVDAILGLAMNLGLKVIVEGVETQHQIDYLKHRKCEYLQGFFFSKPLSKNDLSEYILVNLNNQTDANH